MPNNDGNRDETTRKSWDANAALWVDAVRERRIQSRNTGTDDAIVEAVRRLGAQRVLDVGCGEGWLVRRLAADIGCKATGVDGSADLIAAARDEDETGTYHHLIYDDIIADPAALGGPFDAVVCNFALLGQDIGALLKALAGQLGSDGNLVIQTLHPCFVHGDYPYADGWRSETFASLATGDWQPMPWYFRTLGSWTTTLNAAGLLIRRCEEPADPESGEPLSLLWECAPA